MFPSAAYRFRKFVKRNQRQVIAAIVVLLALLAGMAGATVGLLEAQKQTQIARDEAEQKELARADEAKQRAIAEENARIARTEKANAERAAAAEKSARQEEERQRKFAEAIAQFVKDDFLGLTSVEGQARFGGELGNDPLDRNANLAEPSGEKTPGAKGPRSADRSRIVLDRGRELPHGGGTGAGATISRASG
jgi:hypothetical protein